METTLSAKHPQLYQLAESSCPTLALVSATYTKDTVKNWLNILMEDLFAYTEQPKGVSPHRILEACEFIANAHSDLNLLEVLYFFAQCKSATYGTFFGVSGPLQVANMLNKFRFARQESIQQNEENLHRQIKDSAPTTNGFAEYFALKRRAMNGDTQAQLEINKLIQP